MAATATPSRGSVQRATHLTPDERRALGREARSRTPRSSHADWSSAKGRPDPVALLHAEDATRVPELVPIRYGRMLVSPFTFYRGAAALMAADLDGTPTSGLDVQLCGDADLRAARRNLEKARAKDSVRALARLTERVNGSVRIIPAPPLIVPVHEMFPEAGARDVQTEMRGLLRSYQRTIRPEVRHLASTY